MSSKSGRTTHTLNGQLVRLDVQSKVLRDNPLGDPSDRVLTLWLPPDYSRRRHKLPVMFDLVGFTGSGHSHTNWEAFRENMPQRLDRLFHSGKLGSCIVVFPDCFTALGGNQYINSRAMGRYADYLTRELIPLVDREFRTQGTREHRACFGKSSGGYGAVMHGMQYTEHWGAIANHSGDAGFDLIYAPIWPAVLTHLSAYRQPAHKPGAYKAPAKAQSLHKGVDDGRAAAFLDKFWNLPPHQSPGGMDITCLMLLAMAATYDPDPTSELGFRLPFDLETGELIPIRWRRWLAHDPVQLIAKHAQQLRKLSAVYMDCGWRDQYHIHFGLRQLSALMHKHKVTHKYLEFDGTHSGVDHRMDISLPLLYRAIR